MASVRNDHAPDHNFTLHSILKQRQNQVQSTFVTSIDFTKAFDRLDNHVLLYEIVQSSVEGTM